MTRATLDRLEPPSAAAVARDVRPVMLLTLNVPFDERAVEFAIDTAGETGAELYICDAIPMACENYVGHVARQYVEQLNRRHTDAVERRAKQRGIRTTQMAFHNPKPIKATLEVLVQESVGLLVFGADRDRLGRFTFRRAAKRLRRDCSCLVWIND